MSRTRCERPADGVLLIRRGARDQTGVGPRGVTRRPRGPIADGLRAGENHIRGVVGGEVVASVEETPERGGHRVLLIRKAVKSPTASSSLTWSR